MFFIQPCSEQTIIDRRIFWAKLFLNLISYLPLFLPLIILYKYLLHTILYKYLAPFILCKYQSSIILYKYLPQISLYNVQVFFTLFLVQLSATLNLVQISATLYLVQINLIPPVATWSASSQYATQVCYTLFSLLHTLHHYNNPFMNVTKLCFNFNCNLKLDWHISLVLFCLSPTTHPD